MPSFSSAPLLFTLAIALVVGMGMMAPTQVGINLQLAKTLEHPFRAAWVSFTVGWLLSTALYLALRVGAAPLTFGQWLSIPPHYFLGGVLGVGIVTISIYVGPYVGATLLVVLSLLGQMTAAVLIDQMGWLGFPQHPLTWQRIVGLVLVLLGAWLIRRY